MDRLLIFRDYDIARNYQLKNVESEDVVNALKYLVGQEYGLTLRVDVSIFKINEKSDYFLDDVGEFVRDLKMCIEYCNHESICETLKNIEVIENHLRVNETLEAEIEKRRKKEKEEANDWLRKHPDYL